jgi:hypothetical protein
MLPAVWHITSHVTVVRDESLGGILELFDAGCRIEPQRRPRVQRNRQRRVDRRHGGASVPLRRAGPYGGPALRGGQAMLLGRARFLVWIAVTPLWPSSAPSRRTDGVQEPVQPSKIGPTVSSCRFPGESEFQPVQQTFEVKERGEDQAEKLVAELDSHQKVNAPVHPECTRGP